MASKVLATTVQVGQNLSGSTWNTTSASDSNHFYVGGENSKYVSRIRFEIPKDEVQDKSIKIQIVPDSSATIGGMICYFSSNGDLTPSQAAEQQTFIDAGNPFSYIKDSNGNRITGSVASGTKLFCSFTTSDFIKAGVSYYVYLLPGNKTEGSIGTFGSIWFRGISDNISTTFSYTKYTSPSAPTSASIKRSDGSYIIKPSDDIVVSWSGAVAGTNNPISKYKITVYDNATTSSNTLAEKTVDSSYSSTTFSLSGLTRGHNIQAYIIALGTKSGTQSGIKYTTNTVAVNTLPAKPSGVGITVGSTITSATLSVTAGATNDSGQSASIWYSNTSSGDKQKFYSNTTSLPTPNTGNNLYYFWTFDGLEYSEPLQLNIFRIDKPKVKDFSITTTTFTPYKSVTGVSYVTKIKISDVLYDSLSDGEKISSYRLYISYSDKKGNITGNGFSLMKTYTNSTFIVNISDFVGAGKYFRIAITIVNNFGDESPKKECNDVFACGKAFSTGEFAPDFDIASNIDNNGNFIEISSGDNHNTWFNNYIDISWTNSTIEAPRFGIKRILFGYVDANGGFTQCEYLSDGISVSTGAQNIARIVFEENPIRTTSSPTITPAIKVIQNNGSQLVEKAGETRTRVLLPELRGVTITPSGTFFKDDGDYSHFGLTIYGSLTKGDIGTLGINSLSSSYLTSALTGASYPITYSIDGSSWSKFEIKDISGLNGALNDLKLDIVSNSDFTLTLVDLYGNKTSFTQKVSIDFRVKPAFGIDAKITATISSSNVTDGVINFMEGVSLEWPEASDYGNGDAKQIEYIIKTYRKRNVNTNNEFEISEAELIKTETINSNTYFYTATRSTTPDAIGFTVQALDKSGLYSETLILNQGIILGRSVEPSFEILNYNIDGSQLKGKIHILDYGDSRNTVSLWKNYNRLGYTLSESNSSNSVSISASGDNNIIDFTLALKDGPTSKKINLLFTLEVNNLNISSTKQYLFTFSGPTFSYRSHQIGINEKADTKEDAALIVAGNLDTADTKKSKTKIYFASMKDDGYIGIDLSANALFNFIIDGGDNAWSNTTNTTET